MTVQPLEEKLAVTGSFMSAANRLPTPLYAYPSEWDAVLTQLADGEITYDEAEPMLRGIADDFRHVAISAAQVIRKREHQADDAWAEAKRFEQEALRLKRRAAAFQKDADWLRGYVSENMQAIPGLEKIETGIFTLALRLNNPRVEVVDETAIPDDFKRFPEPPPEVDKIKILEHWRTTGGKSVPTGVEGGEVPPGCQIVRDTRLDLR